MEQEPIVQTKKASMKKAALVALVVFLALAGYGYYWYLGIVERGEQAQAVLSENENLKAQFAKYTMLQESVMAEYNRCQEFISQREGDFGSFEYCKKFIDWVNMQAI
jgi:uncharacterized protein HemX